MRIPRYFLFGVLTGVLAATVVYTIFDRLAKFRDPRVLIAPADWDSAGTVRRCKTKDFPPSSNLPPQYITEDCDSDEIAEELKKKVKVLCFITTARENLDTKMNAVRQTWARRCNLHLFFVSGQPPKHVVDADADADAGESGRKEPEWARRVGDVVYLRSALEGRAHLFQKTMLALEYLELSGFTRRFSWFAKVDDDAYLIVENLRVFLAEALTEIAAQQAINDTDKQRFKVKSTADLARGEWDTAMYTPMYTGRIFVHDGVQYASGGASYVLNAAAVTLVIAGLSSGTCVIPQSTDEDLELGRCLRRIGTVFLDSRDATKEQRFLPVHPSFMLHPETHEYSTWVSQYDRFATQYGASCCARTTVSFHYVTPAEMYLYDFLIYKLNPYGIVPFYHAHARAYASDKPGFRRNA